MAKTLPVKRRARRDTKELRRALLDAARDLFAQHGYAGTSTRDIAKQADAVEPLIYKHFGSKNALFAAAVLEPLSDALNAQVERYRQGLMASQNSDQALKTFIDSMLSVVFAEKKLLIAFMDVTSFQGEDFFVQGAGSTMPVLIEHMHRLEEIGRSAATAAELDVDDWMMETRLSFAMIVATAIMEDLLFAPEERDRDRMRESVFKLLRHGLGGAAREREPEQ